MTTRIADNGITVLSPAVGMRLTDGETVAEGDVFLGANAAPDAWREVTEAEADEILAEAERVAGADAEAISISAYDSMSKRAEAAEVLARRRGTLIQSEAERLREEKSDLDEKIAAPAYITIRPWLRIKLVAVEAAIRKLEEDEGA
jgi:cytosine/adenosine deaminase-related metal-dependent hydrolase